MNSDLFLGTNMNVFILGATGYIGSIVAERIQRAGHHVRGLARSEQSAGRLAATGIEPVRGSLDDHGILADAAVRADAIIHCAFDLAGGDFLSAAQSERAAVRALLDSIRHVDKTLIVTSGTAVLGDTGDRIFSEDTPIPRVNGIQAESPQAHAMRAIGERLAMEEDVLAPAVARGIVLRSPNVYGRGDGKAVLALLRQAGAKLGAVPYAAGTGDHQWSFVHVEDLADLFVLALNKARGGQLFHAGAESSLRTRDIAKAVSTSIGLGGKTIELGIPDLGEALGMPPMAHYWASNSQSSSEKARRLLDWRPAHLQMLVEIARTTTSSRDD